MIREWLTAHCHVCFSDVASREADNPSVVLSTAYGYGADPGMPGEASVHYFTNHTVLATTIRKAGWYIDGTQTLCPEHYRALLARHQSQPTPADDDPASE